VRVPTSAPSDVATGGFVEKIVTGYYHTCALLSGGGVRCWGRNEVGQLGYPGHGDVGDDETPASMPLVDVGGTVVELAAGTYHTCARLDTGAVRCWGWGRFGALGYGNTDNIGDDEHPSSAGAVLGSARARRIFAGGANTCAVLVTDYVYCWGTNYKGMLGYGQPASGSWFQLGDDETPLSVGPVPIGIGVNEIDLEDGSACARFSGLAKCWGSDGSLPGYPGPREVLGDDETVASLPYLPVSSVAEIVTGGSHHCIRTTSGQVRCWGSIPLGGLGYASTAPIFDASLAGNISLGGTATQITSGYAHVCALLTSGGVRCWGHDGALGYAAAGAVGDDETPASMGDVPL